MARCAIEDMLPIISRCGRICAVSAPARRDSVPRAPALPLAVLFLALPAAQSPLDREAERWVTQTLAKLSLDDRIGQLIAPEFDSTYLPTDSDEFDRLSQVMRDSHAGAVIAFGGTEPVPQALLSPGYGASGPARTPGAAAAVVLGNPLALASTLNRLQAAAPVPLLASADFEYGAGMRIAGAHPLPSGDGAWCRGRRAAGARGRPHHRVEGRAMGVHVNFAPVADVNNNPRNPVINTRSFGEDPARVGALVAAYVRGLQQGGMLATIKHFPGHGDTETDSHLGLPMITHPRDRLEALELLPFRAGLAAGAGAVMVAHIELPALDPEKAPATFSRPVVTDLLRRDLAFDGLIVTDAMKMDAITRLVPPGEAAVRAVRAGVDLVLDSPDPVAAFTALEQAVADGQLTRQQIDASAGARASRQGPPGPAPRAGGEHRLRTAVSRWAAASGGRPDDRRAQPHADQGRGQPRAAPAPPRCERALPVGARLSGELDLPRPAGRSFPS